jgi:protein-tyrosine phosphatase
MGSSTRVTDSPAEDKLRVDWIDPERIPDERPGRLGLTFLPGKHGASVRYPGRVYRRDLEQDLATLARGEVRTLILLVEDHELVRWGDLDIVARAGTRGVTVERWPMPDGMPPSSLEVMDALLDSIDAARANGDVAVACMGGVGRTGTVVACALVRAGMAPTDAIAEVRRVRHPTAVETGEQRRFVHAFASHHLASMRGARR